MLKDYDKITENEINAVKFEYNLHTHNYLCNHAEGTVGDYVATAVSNGIKLLGISDHIKTNPKMTDEWLDCDGVENEYLTQFTSPIREFGNKIEILKGGEVEYYDDNDEAYSYLKGKLDYLVLGQHMTEQNGVLQHASCIGSDVKALRSLLEQASRGIDSGYFTVLAHPDYPLGFFDGDVKSVQREFEKLILNAVSNNVLIEFNANGIRKNGFKYPSDQLVDVCKYYDIPVVVSSDCHRPSVIFDEHVRRLTVYLQKQKIRIYTLDEIRNKLNRNPL